MDQSESAILTMWDTDIMLPWLQPWVHKKDGCLINYSPDCRAYTRAKDSAAAQPADSDSNNSSSTICLDARLPWLQSVHKTNPHERVSWKMPFTFMLAKCALDKTQPHYSSSRSCISLCFSTACCNGDWELFPTTENLLENTSTLEHFPIMFSRLDLVNYGSPIWCVLHQPECLDVFVL